jgi:hypothetical protein
MDVKKVAGLSVGGIGFAILVIALDFAVVRAACLSPTPQERVTTGAPLLPGMLAGRLLKRGPDGWAVFAFFLLPMINAILIGVHRLRRRGDHTAGTVGYVAAGSVATLAVFTSCLIWPETAIGMVTPMSRRIALACLYGTARVFGIIVLPAPYVPGWQARALEWAYMVIFAVLIPFAFFCIPPLLVAVIGGRVARHLAVAGPSSSPPSARPER